MLMQEVHVIKNTALTSDTNSILLKKPAGFDYEPGQFIVVQTTIEEKPVRRSYSLASAPHQEHLEIIVKAQPQGLVSPHLCALAAGTTMHILGPFGQFTLQDEQAVLVGAGTGITPFIGYLRHLESVQTPHNITLLAAFRYEKDILLHEELARLTQTLNLTVHITLTRPEPTWKGLKGRVDELMLASFPSAAYYLCGPTPMVVTVKQALTQRGIKDVRTEKYGAITA